MDLKRDVLLALVLLAAAFAVAASAQPGAIPSRTGHIAPINSIAVSLDGRRLVSVSDDGTLRIWDVAGGRELHVISGSPVEDMYGRMAPEVFETVAISPNGKLGAAGGAHSLKVFDAAAGQIIGQLDAPGQESITSISFSPDGKILAVARDEALYDAEDKVTVSTVIFDVATARPVLELKGARAPIAFNPAGTQLVTGGELNELRIWNVKTGKLAKAIKLPATWKKATYVSFNSAGNTLLAANTELGAYEVGGYPVSLWSLPSGTPKDLPAKITTRGLVLFTPDGKSVIVSDRGDDGETLKTVSIATGKVLEKFGKGLEPGSTAVYSPNSKFFAFVDENGRDIQLIDADGKTVYRDLHGHSVNANSVAFSPDGKFILAGYDQGEVVWWDAAGKKISRVVPAKRDVSTISPVDRSNPVKLTPDGRYFLTENTSLKIFDASTGEVRFDDDELFTPSYVISPNGSRLLLRTDETISVRSVPDGKLLYRFAHMIPEDDEYSATAAISSDGTLAAVSFSSAITIWHVPTGKVVQKIEYGELSPPNLQVALGGKYLVAGFPSIGEGKISVYDVGSGEAVLEWPSDRPFIGVSPDGNVLASVNTDRTLRFTPLTEGSEPVETENTYDMDARTPIFETASVSLVFSPDGKRLAVGGRDGIAVFDPATGARLAELR